MKLRYSVLARDVILDNETLSPVIYTPLDAIGVGFKDSPDGEKVAPLEAVFFTVWYAETEEEQNSIGKFRFQVVGPKEPNPGIEVEFSFAGFKRFMHRVRIQGLRYQGVGDYQFTVTYTNFDKVEESVPWTLNVEESAGGMGENGST